MTTSYSSNNYRLLKFLAFVAMAVMSLTVVVGGITRLTHSGLSMVDWQPVMGILPPLTHQDWLKVFASYQKSPEYLIVNHGMSLADFKQIFFWEYLHRILGRISGLTVLAMWFSSLLRPTPSWLRWRSFALAALVGLQGLMGWYMVKSGLAGDPQVSQYRLLAHLFLAFLAIQLTFWTALSLRRPSQDKVWLPTWAPRFSLLFLGLIVVQIAFGALTAGLKAGHFAQTFPKMFGHWIPPMWNNLTPFLVNFTENPATVQWMHRILGALTLVCAGFYLWNSRPRIGVHSAVKRQFFLIALFSGVQFGLGITTLLHNVPLVLGVAHQFLALLILSLTVRLLHWAYRGPSSVSI